MVLSAFNLQFINDRSHTTSHLYNTSITMTFSPVEFIRTRRLCLREHTDEELAWWISSYTSGQLPDYQMSAWLMAVCLNGLSTRETATLTRCMMESGVQVQWRNATAADNDQESSAPSSPPQPHLVDKHSSGGIGDKVSIVLAPLVATFGLQVPMMAGRGLGHTGGTIDKLESIPGFRTDFSVNDFQRIVREIGCIISTTGPTLCPADKKIYALRDVSDTVSSIPLQTASIMCKKIAENPDSLVLDVKYGGGSFQATLKEAEMLAHSMVATGENNGLNPTTAFLTRMDEPIGYAVGNWFEVKECIDLLKGWEKEEDVRLSQDLISLVTCQAGQMLYQSGAFGGKSFQALVKESRETLQNGKALDKFIQMVQAQGGDTKYVTQPVEIKAKVQKMLTAQQDGYLAHIPALTVGQVSVELGAGRRVAGETVDPFAGIWFHAKAGDRVSKRSVIAIVYTNRDEKVLDKCLERLADCLEYSQEADVKPERIVTHRVTKDGIEEVHL